MTPDDLWEYDRIDGAVDVDPLMLRDYAASVTDALRVAWQQRDAAIAALREATS